MKLNFILDKCGLAEINTFPKYLYFEKYQHFNDYPQLGAKRRSLG